MFKLKYRALITLILIFVLCMCIDPYKPKLTEYESLLVVDGLVTNANSSYTVRLSRTFQELNAGPSMVTDASVFLKDDKGTIINLINNGNGTYKTDSTIFRGITGRTYTLHVLTRENEEYESEPCTMLPVADIDSIYIERGQKLVNNETETQDGVSIYLDSKGDVNNRYYRWSYDETWKFKVMYPKKYDYVKNPKDPNNPFFRPVQDVQEICWKHIPTNDILIRSIAEGQNAQITKQPIFFIATEKSDRLLIQYSILVKQYSVSKDEYDFWNNLTKVNETGSDIFARQPYGVLSNIHNVKNRDERVLGYFQVSAVTQKRKNISYRDVALMGLHFFSYPCKTWEFEPHDFDTPCMCPPKTWDDVYWYLCIVSDYTFIEPKYDPFLKDLTKMVFTRVECSDCSLAGSHTKPDYWDDAFNLLYNRDDI